MPKVFGYLERSSPATFWPAAGSRVADIALVSNLINFHYLGYRIDARAIQSWLASSSACAGMPSVATALRTEQPVAKSMGLMPARPTR